METTVKYNVNSDAFDVNNFKELTAMTLATISHAEQFIKENNYKTNVPISHEMLSQVNIYNSLVKLSKTQRKVLRNNIKLIGKGATIERVNRFFHQLMKVVLKSDLRIRVLKSDKEQAIDAKRKAYKDALAIAIKARDEYKAEKGDFYKLQLAKKKAA